MQKKRSRVRTATGLIANDVIIHLNSRGHSLLEVTACTSVFGRRHTHRLGALTPTPQTPFEEHGLSWMAVQEKHNFSG